MNTNKLIKYDTPQKVKVRKYEVDIDKLKLILKENKKRYRLTNRFIANELNQSLTLVEHWFRNDNCFSIPDKNIWLDLKKLLKINTNEFDKSIMEFEIRDGIYEKSNRVYSSEGIAPTITCEDIEQQRFIVF